MKIKRYTKKIFITILIAIIGFGCYLYMNNSDNNDKVTQEKNSIARIDISTDLSDSNEPFSLYLNNALEAEKAAKWMKRRNLYGTTIQTEENTISLRIDAKQNADININLLAEDSRDEDNNQIDNWIQYTSLNLNGEEVLLEPKVVCARKNFKYLLKANADETYLITIKWEEINN